MYTVQSLINHPDYASFGENIWNECLMFWAVQLPEILKLCPWKWEYD
jgi:hypothetical protein